MEVTFGKTTPTSYSDPEVKAVQHFVVSVGKALLPGQYWVESYPILRYIPAFVRELEQVHDEERTLYRSQIDAVQEKMVRFCASFYVAPNYGLLCLKHSPKEKQNHLLLHTCWRTRASSNFRMIT